MGELELTPELREALLRGDARAQNELTTRVLRFLDRTQPLRCLPSGRVEELHLSVAERVYQILLNPRSLDKLMEATNLTGYIVRLSRNHANRELRREERERFEPLPETVAGQDSPTEDLERKERGLDICAVVDGLPIEGKLAALNFLTNSPVGDFVPGEGLEKNVRRKRGERKRDRWRERFRQLFRRLRD